MWLRYLFYDTQGDARSGQETNLNTLQMDRIKRFKLKFLTGDIKKRLTGEKRSLCIMGTSLPVDRQLDMKVHSLFQGKRSTIQRLMS